jgi:excisionase family DNA binding protein
MTRPQELVLTVGEVAERLGVPMRTVRHWSDIGYLPARRTPGGQRRYSPSEVAAFVDRRQAASHPVGRHLSAA